MITVDGYKAFRGTMHVTPADPAFPPFDMTGDWLYKPEYKLWYCRPADGGFSRSLSPDICEVVRED